jgi:hypothetical protein
MPGEYFLGADRAFYLLKKVQTSKLFEATELSILGHAL